MSVNGPLKTGTWFLVTLSAPGLITLGGSLSGINIQQGTGVNDSLVVFTGSALSVNSALSGSTYLTSRSNIPPSTDIITFNVSISYPKTCQDISQRTGSKLDGYYTLYYADNDEATFTAYCTMMSSSNQGRYIIIEICEWCDKREFIQRTNKQTNKRTNERTNE